MRHQRPGLAALQQALQQTDLSIGEICTRIGYEEPKYFIHVFRKQTGTTPLRHRKSKQAS